ncbi:MAG: 2-oxo acid dehydrogenase subunit E2, partial [Bacteroidetes bacterium]|nr:2-oxo acid dehydrogenase subunit E2 [Bacteroidota bacterium]
MAKFELKLPKMGESVAEATITSWLKEIGDTIEEDEAILEIATDKVDSEIPSEVEGVLVEKLFNVDDVIQVGQTIAIIETDANETPSVSVSKVKEIEQNPTNEVVAEVTQTIVAAQETVAPVISKGNRFYSPLVKNIAKKESITQAELDVITGTGKEGRVTKNDILAYLQSRGSQSVQKPKEQQAEKVESIQVAPIVSNGEDEIIEMTRMGKLVAKHMVDSVQTSAHVQSFIEADVTKIWNWRVKVKEEFKNREGENLTFTPIFMEAVAKALRDYPMMNISVQGDTIIK